MTVVSLSLVIPCYNESGSLAQLSDRCHLLTSVADVEVILVDNGSTDDTPEFLVSKLPADGPVRSVRVPINRGYGNGILVGLAASCGEYLGWTHADLQTDPLDVERGHHILSSHGPGDSTLALVKGRRYGRPLGDAMFTVGMSLFETALLRAPLWDINAQPNLFTRALYNEWKNPPEDFSLDLYAYYQARVSGAAVHRFPVLFSERYAGHSHWNVDWKSKSRFIKRTVSYSARLMRST